jgi:hypothetical protein
VREDRDQWRGQAERQRDRDHGSQAALVATARGLKWRGASRRPGPLEACYIVRDANGQALAYVYYEQEPGRRAAAHLLTRDEAWRIAVSIAKLPELLRRKD